MSDYNISKSTLIDHVGTSLIAEYEFTAAGLTLQRRYVYGPGTDEPLVWYEGTGTNDRRFLHADERGSVTAITNTSGAVININRYDEFGIPAASNIGRFGYTGQAWLPEFGLSYYKARMYSPTLGRFMQTDPIGYGDGINFYNYVGGDPVNRRDPSGLMCTTRSTVGSGGNGGETLFGGCGNAVDGGSGVGGGSGVSAPVEGSLITIIATRPIITFDVGNFFADQFRSIGSNDLAPPPPSLSSNNSTNASAPEQRRGRRGSVTIQLNPPTQRQKACAASTGAVFAGASLGVIAGSAAILGAVPTPASLVLEPFAAVSGGAAAILGGLGTLGQLLSCN